MPEEINRVVTDRLARLLFAPSRDAVHHLHLEGVSAERVHMVGNVMIDSLIWSTAAADRLHAPARHGVADQPYAVVTLHRPANVDSEPVLRELLETFVELGRHMPVLFPVHPRTRARLDRVSTNGCLRLLPPVPYLEMLSLVRHASIVITDSGGLQEETSYLGVPCVTVRPNTERPITVTHGTNRLSPPERAALLDMVDEALAHGIRPRSIERWDGKAAERIADVLCNGARFE